MESQVLLPGLNPVVLSFMQVHTVPWVLNGKMNPCNRELSLSALSSYEFCHPLQATIGSSTGFLFSVTDKKRPFPLHLHKSYAVPNHVKPVLFKFIHDIDHIQNTNFCLPRACKLHTKVLLQQQLAQEYKPAWV